VNVLGLILARGGSKRIPGKNMRLLGGYPLITWAISAARCAHLIDRVVVSSDSEEILIEARRWNADTVERPSEMASDDASPYPSMLHALDSFDEHFDYLCLLQPTSPFRIPIDIDLCLRQAFLGSEPAVVSVARGSDQPNGAIYVADTTWLRETLAAGNEWPFDGKAPVHYVMPPERSLDIDTEEQFAEAEEMVEGWA